MEYIMHNYVCICFFNIFSRHHRGRRSEGYSVGFAAHLYMPLKPTRWSFTVLASANDEVPKTAVPPMDTWGWLQKVNPHRPKTKMLTFTAEINMCTACYKKKEKKRVWSLYLIALTNLRYFSLYQSGEPTDQYCHQKSHAACSRYISSVDRLTDWWFQL